MHPEPVDASVDHVAVVVQYLELDKPEGRFTYDVHKMFETMDLLSLVCTGFQNQPAIEIALVFFRSSVC